jgi:hypothetical protein
MWSSESTAPRVFDLGTARSDPHPNSFTLGGTAPVTVV